MEVAIDPDRREDRADRHEHPADRVVGGRAEDMDQRDTRGPQCERGALIREQRPLVRELRALGGEPITDRDFVGVRHEPSIERALWPSVDV